jgi:rhodanese-related sulfurtransferase
MHDKTVDGAKRLVLYCASGGRSVLAAKTLLDMGFANICHMGGGFGAWTQAGGPVAQV